MNVPYGRVHNLLLWQALCMLYQQLHAVATTRFNSVPVIHSTVLETLCPYAIAVAIYENFRGSMLLDLRMYIGNRQGHNLWENIRD